MRFSVLFVCTANINRSAIAEALFRKQLAKDSPNWKIGSAGTWARDGHPAARHVHTVMLQRGADVSLHRSRAVTSEILADYQLILVMEQNHKEALGIEFPEARGRIYLLSEMLTLERDVADPIGGPLVDFEATADEITHYLQDGFARIRELARIKANKIG